MLKLVLIVVAVLIALAVGGLLWAYARFNGEIKADVAALTSTAAATPGTITPAELAALPEPAQRYFARAGVLGKPIPRLVTLNQRGRIRSNPQSGWMEFEASETYSINPPAFVWRTFLPSRALPIAMGRDEYLGKTGSILIKVGSLVAMANEHGSELDQAGLMRFLNEMTSFPAALLASNIAIEPVDADSFRLTITDGERTASGVLVVDKDGLPLTFRAPRFNTSTRSVETWETPFTAYGSVEEITVPTAGSAVWKEPGGDFDYIEITISDIRYQY